VKWNATVTSSQLISPVAEEQKVSYIKYLHPFENKVHDIPSTYSILLSIASKYTHNA
jgi:hypothetical protein